MIHIRMIKIHISFNEIHLFTVLEFDKQNVPSVGLVEMKDQLNIRNAFYWPTFVFSTSLSNKLSDEFKIILSKTPTLISKEV